MAAGRCRKCKGPLDDDADFIRRLCSTNDCCYEEEDE